MPKLTLWNSREVLRPGFTFGGYVQKAVPAELSANLKCVRNLPSPELGTDQFWMQETLLESMKSIGLSRPNPGVGCILLDARNQEVARGSTEIYKGRHAERVAFDSLGPQKKTKDLLKDGTAFVTLEPCSHQGHQPPCVDLLANSTLRRVVIATKDPNPKVNGEGIERLRAAGKIVEVGLFGLEATAWNYPFFLSQSLGRPLVALKWAQTLDGQLADDNNKSQWISGPESRAYTHWLRQKYDAILVGAKTFLQDSPKLTARDCAGPIQAQPFPIVLDLRGTCLSSDFQNQSEPFGRPWALFTTRRVIERFKPGPAFKKQLKKLTLFVIEGDEPAQEILAELNGYSFESLIGRPFQSLFVEGGPITLGLFLKAGVADVLHTFVCPRITGGVRNRIPTLRSLDNALQLHTPSSCQLGSDILMELVPVPLL